MTYYKIRKKDDHTRFVRGTPVYHSYAKTGRIFQSLGNLRSFLTGVMNNPYENINVTDWEIVELEMVVKDIKDVHEVITAKRLTELLTK